MAEKKRSLAESEKGNVMEGKETLVEEEKKSSVVGELASLVEREKESLVMKRKWRLVEGKKGKENCQTVALRRVGFNHRNLNWRRRVFQLNPKACRRKVARMT